MMAESSSETSDLYANLKSLQKSLEFLDIQEEYIKDEMKNLKRELIRAKEVCAVRIMSSDEIIFGIIFLIIN